MVGSFVAHLNVVVFDFVARRKIQGQHLNWYIVEQLPVVPPDRYDTVHFGKKTAAIIVRDCVLELTDTAHDMAHFARDMGYVDRKGEVNPPFLGNNLATTRLILRLWAFDKKAEGIAVLIVVGRR